jgi:hypothetical protein
VRAHTANASVEHVGNRIADCVAKHYLTADASIQALDLEREEDWLAVRWEDLGTTHLLTSDPRRECQRREYYCINTVGNAIPDVFYRGVRRMGSHPSQENRCILGFFLPDEAIDEMEKWAA